MEKKRNKEIAADQQFIGKLWWNADDMTEAKQWATKYLAKGAISVELKPEDDRSVVSVIITLDRNRAKEILGHTVGKEEWLDIADDDLEFEELPKPTQRG